MSHHSQDVQFDECLPVRVHSQRHKSRCRSGRVAPRGSSGHGGPLVRPLSGDSDDNYLCFEHFLNRGSRLQWEKNESQKFNGCPILSQAIGQEKLRTVFVFALVRLEGPPTPSLATIVNSNSKICKNQFSETKSVRSVLQ